jgi:hypothetical protein
MWILLTAWGTSLTLSGLVLKAVKDSCSSCEMLSFLQFFPLQMANLWLVLYCRFMVGTLSSAAHFSACKNGTFALAYFLQYIKNCVIFVMDIIMQI